MGQGGVARGRLSVVSAQEQSLAHDKHCPRSETVEQMGLDAREVSSNAGGGRVMNIKKDELKSAISERTNRMPEFANSAKLSPERLFAILSNGQATYKELDNICKALNLRRDEYKPQDFIDVKDALDAFCTRGYDDDEDGKA